MKLFPAIDLFNGKAVRLFKGDYQNMTIYSEHPEEIAIDFYNSGAQCMHVVDLEGAKSGQTPNIETVKKLVNSTPAFVEVGGGIRNMQTVETYLNAGVSRVILGTSAVTDKEFLISALSKYGDKIAVGADIKDGYVAIKGWVEKSNYTVYEFFDMLDNLGVKTVICTDVSKDGAMSGTNVRLYKELSSKYKTRVIASGGVSSINDVINLKNDGIYGAIIGKAYYVKAINLKTAIEVANDN